MPIVPTVTQGVGYPAAMDVYDPAAIQDGPTKIIFAAHIQRLYNIIGVLESTMGFGNPTNGFGTFEAAIAAAGIYNGGIIQGDLTIFNSANGLVLTSRSGSGKQFRYFCQDDSGTLGFEQVITIAPGDIVIGSSANGLVMKSRSNDGTSYRYFCADDSGTLGFEEVTP